MTGRTTSYLPDGLPVPVPDPDGLSAPYWQGLQEGRIRVQRCNVCTTWQWGPEWICHRCHSEDLAWEEVAGEGVIYSSERAWHPVHPALNNAGPYLVVLVELPHAGGVRMIGNLLGDPQQVVRIGAAVVAEFEHHPGAKPAFSLLQWRVADT